jgi:hypothetical protein
MEAGFEEIVNRFPPIPFLDDFRLADDPLTGGLSPQGPVKCRRVSRCLHSRLLQYFSISAVLEFWRGILLPEDVRAPVRDPLR